MLLSLNGEFLSSYRFDPLPAARGQPLTKKAEEKMNKNIPNLENMINEVHRKIGRNVMLFQQIEHLLKSILTDSGFSGYFSELEAKQEQRIVTNKQTMGQVKNKFFEKVIFPIDETNKDSKTSEELDDIQEPYFSYRITFHDDKNYYEARKKALDLIVAERNELIHHLLPKWDFDSLESSKAIEKYLDQQQEKLLPELFFLKKQMEYVLNSNKSNADFFASGQLEDILKYALENNEFLDEKKSTTKKKQSKKR
jgi:hypothetical protein